VQRSWSSFKMDSEHGNSIDFGNFDQCLSIREKLDDGEIISGQYCLVQLSSTSNQTQRNPPERSLFNGGWKDMDKRFGGAICIPLSCSPEAIPALMSEILKETEFQLSTDYNQRDFCKISVNEPTSSDKFGASTSFMIWLASTTLIVLFVFMCSIRCLSSADPGPKNRKQSEITKIFSLTSNVQDLIDTESVTGDIKCLHGLRVLSIIGIIFFHTFFHRIMFPFHTSGESPFLTSTLPGRFFVISTTFVDLFFVMSGLLTTRTILKDFDS
jgi:Nose resistant-to-fluoxetine protein, N-terminal domain